MGKVKNLIVPENKFEFYNTMTSGLTLEEVFKQIEDWIKEDPIHEWVLTIGSDSQVKKYTHFVTTIHLHKGDKGARMWSKDFLITRRMAGVKGIKERIMTECTLTQELMMPFIESEFSKIADIILPHIDKGANFIFHPHVDIGEQGATKSLIREVNGMFRSLGFEVKIKPESYAASWCANKYTK